LVSSTRRNLLFERWGKVRWFSDLKGRFYKPRPQAANAAGGLGNGHMKKFFGPERAVQTLQFCGGARQTGVMRYGGHSMPQSLARIYIHLVFSTKDRKPLLADKWRDELFHVLGGAANNFGCQSLIVGGTADHVHMLFQLGRTISIAEAVGKIKSTSSAWINQSVELPEPFHWQAGYAAFSVSESVLEPVREYIRRQPEHHQKQSFQDELREWLRRYGIEWDERYLWD
jgi:putative transposase